MKKMFKILFLLPFICSCDINVNISSSFNDITTSSSNDSSLIEGNSSSSYVDTFEQLPDYQKEVLVLLNYFYQNGDSITDLKNRNEAQALYEKAFENIKNTNSELEAYAVLKNAKKEIGVYFPLASEDQVLTTKTYEEKTQLLAALEEYASDNHLTGLSLYDNGYYGLFSRTVELGLEKQVQGYGNVARNLFHRKESNFAEISEGKINSGLLGEINPEWKEYFHTYVSSDNGQFNKYGNQPYSIANGYCASSFYDIRVNESKDGFEYYPLLAKEMPVPMNEDKDTGLATKYRLKIKTGEDGLKYSTLTTNSLLKSFDGRKVEAEDYITAMKLYFTKAYDLGNFDDIYGENEIKGTYDYYLATSKGLDNNLWNNVGLKVYKENKDCYLEVEFVNSCTSFVAMNYLSVYDITPVPKDFISSLGLIKDKTGAFASGATLFGKTDLNLTPVDTFLSLGPYTIETYVKKDYITLKRNYDFTECGNNRYKTDGIHIKVLADAKLSSEDVCLQYFDDFKLSYCDIPQNKIEARNRDDSNSYAVYHLTSQLNSKLNLNTCTVERWEKLFGVDGSITKTEKENYWNVKPAMSNKNFINGLSWSLNRESLADLVGKKPAVDYLGESYISNPENGVCYNDTNAHKYGAGFLNNYYESSFGYNVEVAKEYFKLACAEFIFNNDYKENDVITIEVAWQNESESSTIGEAISQMWQDTFNLVGAEYGLSLKIDNYVAAVWSSIFSKKMMKGQFDIAYGLITSSSGSSIDYFELLKSDNSSGFTLNWGIDTNETQEGIYFKGYKWSYDALWYRNKIDVTSFDGNRFSWDF